MTPSRPSMSSRIKSSTTPAIRRLRRVGWMAEDGVDAGKRMARAHPGKVGLLAVGVIVLATGILCACCQKK